MSRSELLHVTIFLYSPHAISCTITPTPAMKAPLYKPPPDGVHRRRAMICSLCDEFPFGAAYVLNGMATCDGDGMHRNAALRRDLRGAQEFLLMLLGRELSRLYQWLTVLLTNSPDPTAESRAKKRRGLGYVEYGNMCVLSHCVSGACYFQQLFCVSTFLEDESWQQFLNGLWVIRSDD